MIVASRPRARTAMLGGAALVAGFVLLPAQGSPGGERRDARPQSVAERQPEPEPQPEP